MSIEDVDVNLPQSDKGKNIDKEKLLKHLEKEISSHEREIDRILSATWDKKRIFLDVNRGKVLALRYLMSKIFSGEFDE